MKKITTLILFISFSIVAFSQNDAYHDTLTNQLQNLYGLSGGSWVLTPNEATNAGNAVQYGFTSSQNTPQGQDFSIAINMNVPTTGSNPWDAGYFIPNVNSIQTGDKLLLLVWLRTISTPMAQPSSVSIFAEDAVTYHKEVYLAATPTPQWQQYIVPFESSDNYSAGDLNIGFHIGDQQQVLEMGGLAVINYQSAVQLNALPIQLNIGSYDGSDPNAPWRVAAANRIEQHRKADMQLQIFDGPSTILANTSVRVEMIEHDFAFGTEIDTRRIANNSLFNSTYQSKLLDLDGNGHGFNWIVPGNPLKWDAWEEGWSGTPTETVNGIAWLKNNGFKVRGHVLVWPGWNFLPNDMVQNSNNTSYLKSRIDGRINTILNYPGIDGMIDEWDFINEVVHVRDLENAFKGTAGYTTGRELYAEIFNKAYQEDPNIVSYMNEYNILNNGKVNGADYVEYKSMIQEIIDAGETVDGIGFQGHMNSALVAPDSLYALYEDCWQTFGKPIKVTEYDQAKIIPDTIAAKYTRDFLTMTFSHPAVNGFLMWGFWDGIHWLGNSPLYNQDWTPKPTHAEFVDLLFNQWWTDSTLTTDANGMLSLRGFKGKYKITATINGVETSALLEMTDDINTTINLYPVSTQSILEESVKVFPVPFQHQVNIVFEDAKERNIAVYSIAGQLIHQSTYHQQHVVINTSDYPKGVYNIVIQEGETMMVKEIMK